MFVEREMDDVFLHTEFWELEELTESPPNHCVFRFLQFAV